METQKLANINVSNSQLNASKNAGLPETTGPQQQSPFEDRLNKQIEQLRENRRDEEQLAQAKDKKNQRDSISTLDGISESKTREKAASEVQHEQKKNENEFEMPEKPVSSNNIGAQQTDPVDTQPESAERIIAQGETDLLLPLSGAVLPLSERDIKNVGDRADARLAPGLESGRIRTDLSARFNTPAELRADQLQKGAAVPENVRVVEQSVITAPLQTAFKLADKTSMQFYQPAQTSKILTETPPAPPPAALPADIITQTAQLQQVPFTTLLSKSTGERADTDNSLQQSALQTPGTGVSSVLPSGVTSLGHSQLNSLSTAISAQLSSPDWSAQMRQKVSMMLQGGIQKADIKLNPAHLGPMEIKLSMSDDRASISFVTQHAPVREAIEQAMPKLREMLEEQGLNLVDVDVSTYAEQQHKEQQSDEKSNSRHRRSADETPLQENIPEQQGAGINVVMDSAVNIYA
ncbi:Flagellar hook-length control protein FliK [hydrothermal vent metagenome]|uniref:Flagellar hook-length control protein FliK n=1 Tax=hydrothermal vent metagenome TaxID=652676 RepID=A0A3B0XK18_9ZZZZ